jgi:hypothetical protein
LLLAVPVAHQAGVALAVSGLYRLVLLQALRTVLLLALAGRVVQEVYLVLLLLLGLTLFSQG